MKFIHRELYYLGIIKCECLLIPNDLILLHSYYSLNFTFDNRLNSSIHDEYFVKKHLTEVHEIIFLAFIHNLKMTG
ncbi:hypothetical protein OLEAN_C28760 [Oleispira antarctica RB-8]|uniref:Uncharacterized protein n=1 Tax=Oleispira antarctica RB-8 TaxID=698738 RepID=R4YPR2_OLEAN|nr:hypothetical protein OLEAN_C28760 [Oleispira antarctica RB-8]